MKPFIFGIFETSNALGLSVIVDLKQPPVSVPSDSPLAIYYGGWSLPQLEECPGSVKNWRSFEARKFGSNGYRSEQGCYALRAQKLPTSVEWEQQLACPDAGDGWTSCPIAIAVTGLLLCLQRGLLPFGQGLDFSCAEPLHSGHRLALSQESSVIFATDTTQFLNGTTFSHLRRIECKKLG